MIMKRAILGIIAALALTFGAYAAGMFQGFPIVGRGSYCNSSVNGVCNQTIPAGPSVLTGNELIPADTGLPQGQSPQTVLVSMASLGALPYQYEAPLTGASITVASTTGKLILGPAGTIATLTVVFPAASTLADGQTLEVGTSNTVTALTITPGSGTTVSNTPTALTVSTTASYGYKFIYRTANTNWYRLQ